MNFESLVNVCIFIGGCSVEHEISLISGLQAFLNMDKDKYDVRVVYLSKDNEFIYLKKFNDLELFKSGKYLSLRSNCYFKRENNTTYLVYKNKKWVVDVCFPVVHGKGAEDGTLAGFIDLLKVPNVCSGILASSIAQDKVGCKKMLKSSGIRMKNFIEVNKTNISKQVSKILSTFSFPLIIKPARLGSSIGIKVCEAELDLEIDLTDAFMYDDKVIVEEKIVNFVEYNMACFKDRNNLVCSLVEEVKSNHDYLTYADKYQNGGLKELEKDNRVIPADISQELYDEISNYTKVIYNALEFTGVIRVDYLYDLDSHKLYFNEVNTIPGSLGFYLYKDYSFKELLDLLIKDAVYNFNRKSDMVTSFKTNVLSIKDLKMKK